MTAAALALSLRGNVKTRETPSQRKVRMSWSLEEDEALCALYLSTTPIEAISAALERSVSAIHNRTKILKLRRPPEFYAATRKRQFCRPAEIRFEEKVDRSSGDCWMWTGSTGRKGYGQLRFGKRLRLATHVAWEMYRGEVPKGIFVCHHCDTPACVNPDHLFLGTALDNTRDAMRKGRLNLSGLELGRGVRRKESAQNA